MFQVCGSPHAHCLLWVEGAPHIDADSNDDVCTSIDYYFTSKIPPDTDDSQDVKNSVMNLVRIFKDLVMKPENNAHSAYCR